MTDIKSQQKPEIVLRRRRCHPPRITGGIPIDLRRILLVSPFLPFPPESGAKQRTYFLWKALSEIAPVDVVLCNDPYSPNVTASSMTAPMNFLGRFSWQLKGHSLRRLFKKSTLSLTVDRLLHVTIPKHWDYEVDYRINQSLSDVLGRHQYALAVGRYLKPIVKTGIVGRMPCLLDVDDIDFDILSQQAQEATHPPWRRFLNATHSGQIKRAFQKWLPQFDGLWVTKAGDTGHPVTRNAAILPNIPYNIPAVAPQPNSSRPANPIILTVGVLTYLPNRNGIDRFIREGWPRVRAACPTAEYWLAGKNDPGVAGRWQTIPGVKVLGFVDDLAALYKASWLTLCPLWMGAGTNIKVLESLAFERTCVATVIGHRGFENCLLSGDSLLVATSAENLAESCVSLINNHERRFALAKRGREVVQREFSYQKFASIVHREVERVAAEKFCK
jgi:glycosyltransferase involved in cell wall biosynthesis